MSKPKQVNQVINHSQIDSENKQIKPSQSLKQWSNETEKLVLGLFARFGDLFQNKCKAQGLEIYDNDEKYTQTFKLWCKKLEEAQICVEDVARGIKHIEEAMRDSARTGIELWPPSYAEFIGHCQKQKDRELHKPWMGLPRSRMTNDERKENMRDLRNKLGL